MIKTEDYKTATEIMERVNVGNGTYWPLAVDYGFSAVKGFSPNSVYRFPSYAKEVTGSLIGEPRDTDIQYRDEDGVVWNVGQMAQDMVTSDNVSDSADVLYSRNRYQNPMFRVIVRVGLALGLMDNACGTPQNKTIVLQTGLPASYVREDAEKLRNVIKGEHEFEVKAGKKNWIKFKINLPESNINIMPQPLGSLYSAVCDKQGEFISGAGNILASNSLVFDGGFGTFDAIPIINRQIDIHHIHTDEELGMKRILMHTIDEIKSKHGVYVPVQAFQKCLADGYVKTFVEETMTRNKVDFSDILENASQTICMNMLKKMRGIYNNFLDFDNIIVTGGTGAAWFDIITEYLSRMETLNVIGANQNDDLPHVYSNVRGYYMKLVNSLNKRAA